MVEGVAVQNQRGTLGDEHAVVDKVLRGTVRRRVPERRVHAQNLLDDRTDVRQLLFVLSHGPAVPSHHAVELVVGAGLNVRVLANESEEPLDDARSLRGKNGCQRLRHSNVPVRNRLTE